MTRIIDEFDHTVSSFEGLIKEYCYYEGELYLRQNDLNKTVGRPQSFGEEYLKQRLNTLQSDLTDTNKVIQTLLGKVTFHELCADNSRRLTRLIMLDSAWCGISARHAFGIVRNNPQYQHFLNNVG